ncbi:UDP-N-acetylmuramoyl-L-alanine--D-glutamate ligase [Laedolimicola intestinihominis]|uniref:UDP-N-acetylmuramoylalanine--D-glutamate ligase n=1 Tax=Laedolimicola intestinihominis TaxID=3133166 RepID=A0ABV1FFN7_9FIRM
MITDKKIVVIGSGVSGVGAVKLLEAAGAVPTLYDSNEKLTEAEVRKRLPEGSKCKVVLGEFPENLKKETELVVLSPGVPVDLPLVEELRTNGAAIWGEVELAYHFGKGKIAAITGTNGKTTTTTLVGEIFKSYYPEVFVVGNIGTAYTQEALKMTDNSVIAAEISSFQLETIENFHPKVSAILNITPDHLNRHHTMQCYIETKEKIAENQTRDDTCVLNYDDEETRRFGGSCKASVLYFSREHILDQGVYMDGTAIVYADESVRTKICDVSELKLLGTHNYENVMAAVAIAAAMGVPFPYIRETVIHFTAVEHRIEFVAEKKGVAYYNDSKGTNTDASIKAVQAMNRPTIVIGGGYDKHVTFDDWIACFGDKVKWLVLLGQTANQIAETAKKHGFTHIVFTESLEEAVQVCAGKAESGDAVLLSPACASWGMFDNYEQRGRMFKDYVRALPE